MVSYIVLAIGMIIALLFLTVFFLILWIMGGVGFKNLWAIYKVKKKVQKGFILVKIRELTGYSRLIAYELKDGASIEIELNDKLEKYVFHDYCVYPHEFAKLPTIEFIRGNAEPLDPRTGLQTVMSSKVLNNTVSKIVKADAILNSPIEDFIKKYGLIAVIFIAIVVGVLVYLNMNTQQSLSQCMNHITEQAVINISSLGK